MLQDPFEMMDLNKARGIGSNRQVEQTRHLATENDAPGDQNIDDLMLYDGMNGYEPAFAQWMPEMDEPGNQTEGYGWEFSQGMGRTPPSYMSDKH
jgi:hypothetical protein